MAGRWLRLAVSAHYDKAIDFSQVSRDDPHSLLREKLILDEAERRLSQHYITLLASNVSGSGKPAPERCERLDKLEEVFVEKILPWLSEKSPTEDTSQAKSLEDYYYSTIETLKKNKQKKKDEV